LAIIATMRVALLLLVGCGRIAFDPLSRDAAVDACVFGPWSAPVRLDVLNSAANEYGPTPSPDGLELVFQSERAGSFDLYRARRATLGEPFGMVESLTALNSAVDDENATFSPDGLTIYFTTTRMGASLLYRATRTQPGGDFSPPVVVSELATTPLWGPALTKQGDELFFTQDVPSDTLWRGTFDGTFHVVGPVSELNIPLATGFPGITPDALTLVYDGRHGTGADIYEATRPAIGGTFGPETAISAINSTSSETDPEISYDGREIYFSSLRSGGAGNEDIYVATRSCL
jgi:hypothetical protein